MCEDQRYDIVADRYLLCYHYAPGGKEAVGFRRETRQSNTLRMLHGSVGGGAWACASAEALSAIRPRESPPLPIHTTSHTCVD
jgi:hypothetical protein